MLIFKTVQTHQCDKTLQNVNLKVLFSVTDSVRACLSCQSCSHWLRSRLCLLMCILVYMRRRWWWNVLLSRNILFHSLNHPRFVDQDCTTVKMQTVVVERRHMEQWNVLHEVLTSSKHKCFGCNISSCHCVDAPPSLFLSRPQESPRTRCRLACQPCPQIPLNTMTLETTGAKTVMWPLVPCLIFSHTVTAKRIKRFVGFFVGTIGVSCSYVFISRFLCRSYTILHLLIP